MLRLLPETDMGGGGVIAAMGTEASRAESESIIRDALRRDLSLFESKERLTSLEIRELERKYDMDSIDFLEEFERGALGDDQDYFVWWSLIRGLEAIRSRKHKIKKLLAIYCGN